MKKYLIISLLCLGPALTCGAQHWSLTWEKFNSTGPKLKQIGRLETKTAGELGPSQWSVGCETLDRDYAVFENYKQYVGELGAASARIQSGWAKTEQKKGKYEFEWLDKIVDGLNGQGVRPWMCLCYGNPIYGSNKGLGSRIFTDEETMSAWLKYVEAVVKRYKYKVNEWEIWNEPNLGKNTKYSDAYAVLLMNTTDVIKRVQPDAVIIGFGLSRMPIEFTREVFDIMKKNGKERSLDYISFHPYFENPDHSAEEITALRDLALTYDPDIKLFQGECGCPATLEWGHALRYYEWTEYSQAKWDVRRMANDWMLGIRSSVFTLVDLQYPNMLQSFGLIRMNLLKQVVYKRPSFYGVQHMVNIFRPGITPTGQMEYTANTHRAVTISGMRDKDGSVFGALLWYSDRIPGDQLEWDELDMTVRGLDLQDPVYVDIITGRVYELPKYHGRNHGGNMKFTGLPVWDSPVMLVERNRIAMKGTAEGEKTTGTTNDMLF